MYVFVFHIWVLIYFALKEKRDNQYRKYHIATSTELIKVPSLPITLKAEQSEQIETSHKVNKSEAPNNAMQKNPTQIQITDSHEVLSSSCF